MNLATTAVHRTVLGIAAMADARMMGGMITAPLPEKRSTMPESGPVVKALERILYMPLSQGIAFSILPLAREQEALLLELAAEHRQNSFHRNVFPGAPSDCSLCERARKVLP